MLHLAHSNADASSSGRSEQSFLPQLDLLALARMAYRQWPTILGGVLAMLLLASLYLFTAVPKYTANFLILVDTRKNPVMARGQDASGERVLDPGLVESQVEILKSDSVALSVVRDLKLTTDPEFLGTGGGLTSWLRSLVSSGGAPSNEDRERGAVDALAGSIKAKRLGTTYVIQVDYTGLSPVKTAQIANALADAYMVGELEARYQATRRAGRWLQDRIRELRDQASAADAAVQKFKSDNNIVDTSRGLMSEQQLSDVNSQLVQARAATAEAKARLDRVVEVSNSDIVNATVADALRSEVITRLRAQYLDLSTKQADFAARFGTNHGAVVNLRNQMAEIARSAREELRRVAESTRSDYEIALTREESIKRSLDGLISQAGTSNQAQVDLRNLESSAQTFRNLYDTFLQKFEETTQEQTFPVNNARVITPATVPTRPSSPKTMLVLAAGSAAGLLLGLGVALLREIFGNGFRNADDVKSYAGLECLGTLPNLARSLGKVSRKAVPDPAILGSTVPIARQAVLAPFSRFTETLRNVKVSIDMARGASSTVTGIISSVPHEGKTTFSANMALLAAQMGHKVLLIDADMHRGSLTKTLRPDATAGLIEVLTGERSLSDVVRSDSITGLDFIPTVVSRRHDNVVSLLTSQTMADILAVARRKYDFVFLDLPPVVPVVDVKASSHLMDNFVFIVEWGRTSRDVVRDAMVGAEQVRQKVIGVILNKADPRELKRIESYRGPAYGSYYIEADAA